MCSPDYLSNYPSIQEGLANGRLNLDCHPSFYLVFAFSKLLQFPEASTSLRYWAGLVGDKSCNVDVENELLPKLADNPGTTRGTKLSVLHVIVFSSLVNRGF